VLRGTRSVPAQSGQQGAVVVNSAQVDTSFTRSLSRRKALVAATAGIGVAAFGAASIRAQGATLVATPVTSGEVAYLFVQVGFSAGTLEPNGDGAYQLTLDGAPEQTVFFSDRPDRIAGAIATERFLEILGFDPGNPPNAALVIQIDAETTDVIVLELTAPMYDPEVASLTYTATLLEGFEQLVETGVGFVEQPLTTDSLPEEFGASILFIDSLLGCSFLDPRGC